MNWIQANPINRSIAKLAIVTTTILNEVKWAKRGKCSHKLLHARISKYFAITYEYTPSFAHRCCAPTNLYEYPLYAWAYLRKWVRRKIVVYAITGNRFANCLFYPSHISHIKNSQCSMSIEYGCALHLVKKWGFFKTTSFDSTYYSINIRANE